jgi:superfamily I DNA/RNA helicase
VALTRAKEFLCLTCARSRMLFGRKTETRRSPFLSDIDEAIKEYGRKEKPKAPPRATQRQLDLFG